jgi:hypothetical protein
MRTIKLNPLTGDIDLTNGQMTLIEGSEAIRQKLRIGIRMFQGEWFLDTRLGLPYYQRILPKTANRDDIAILFKRAILSCDGVLSVSNLTFSFTAATRLLTISFVAVIDGGVKVPVNDAFVVR